MRNQASESEMEVLKVVWANPGSSSNAIYNALKTSQSWTNTTVKTLLSRLVQKGYLDVKQEGRRYLYYATNTENDAMFQRVDALANSLCVTNIGNVLVHLINNYDLSIEDHDKILNALQNKDFKASLKCSCVMNHSSCGCSDEDCACQK